MIKTPLNTAPIQQYIQQVKSADMNRTKEVKLDIVQARNLAYTLGIVMARLEGNLEELLAADPATESIEIQLDGGKNWQ